MSELHASLEQWARFYVTRRQWKLIPIHVTINGQCSCGKFPCGDVKDPAAPWGTNAGKHPVQSNWNTPHLAVQSVADVLRWWPGTPSAMPYSVGLLCGTPSGVVILDVDPRNGGLDSLEELELNIGPLPYTLKAISGSGGFHFYFNVPAGIRIKKGPLHKDLPGLDFQSDGSQTLLPPSSHASGNHYKWADGMSGAEPIADLPDDLLRLAMERKGGGGASGDKLDYTKIQADGIPDGKRNDTLYKIAVSQWRKNGTDDADAARVAVATVKAYNAEFCKPPLDGDEVQLILDSAYSFVKDNPDITALTPEQQAWVERQRGLNTGTSGDDRVPADAGGAAASGDASSASPAVDAGQGGDGPADPDDPGDADGPDLPDDQDSLGDAQDGDFRTLTENGNARRLVDYNHSRIRYTPAFGWYDWTGTYWAPDDEALKVTELARHLPVNIVSEIPRWPQQLQTDVAQWSVQSRQQGRIKKAVALANSDPRIIVPARIWDADSHLLGVRNGVIDLRTGLLIPPNREQYITKRTAIEYIQGRRDTRWEIFLDQVTEGDKELQAWLRRVIGYTLTGSTIEEKFFLIYGPPGSGKSTILEVVKALLGDYGLTLLAENIMANRGGGSSAADMYFNAEIQGRRMVAVSELPEAQMMKEDAVKRLTGADTMMGRKIAQQPVQFTSNAKLWVATNHRPRVGDQGIWRRMRAIPFLYQPTVLDKTLKPYLMDPMGGLPGVMSWAVEGAVEWYATGTLGTAAKVDEATSEYRQAEDEMGQFLAEETRKSDGGSVVLGELFGIYRQWMTDRGIENAGNIGKFQRSLVDRGLDVDGSGRRALVQGVAIVPRAVETSTSGGGLAGLYERARGL